MARTATAENEAAGAGSLERLVAGTDSGKGSSSSSSDSSSSSRGSGVEKSGNEAEGGIEGGSVLEAKKKSTVVRQPVELKKSLPATLVAGHVDRAMEAIKALSGAIKEAEKLSSAGVPSYTLGTVFVHKRKGFRGVVCRVDPFCKHSPSANVAKGQWTESEVIRNPYQPFYLSLVHSPFAGKASSAPGMRFVAEDNVVLAKENETDVNHPHFERLFEGFDEQSQTYIPTEDLIRRQQSADSGRFIYFEEQWRR